MPPLWIRGDLENLNSNKRQLISVVLQGEIMRRTLHSFHIFANDVLRQAFPVEAKTKPMRWMVTNYVR